MYLPDVYQTQEKSPALFSPLLREYNPHIRHVVVVPACLKVFVFPSWGYLLLSGTVLCKAMKKPISRNNPPAYTKLLAQIQTRLFKAALSSPKRKFNLNRQLCSPAILQMGAERVDQVKGRRASANRPALPGMSASRLSQMLKGLAADVDSGNYKPMSPRKVLVSKSNGKTRTLTIPSTRDHVLQQALLLLLHPIAEAELEQL